MYKSQYSNQMKNLMKKLCGNTVLHPTFGLGVVSDVDDNYIFVRFEDRKSKFVNNESFFQYCQVQDENLEEILQSELERLKAQDDEEHRLFRIEMEEEAKRRAKETIEKAETRKTKGKRIARKAK